MKQKAHAWVALRALRLIDESNNPDSRLLVELLSYYLSDVWDGAWIPDTILKDMNYGHIFKMDSDERFMPEMGSKRHRRISYADLKKATCGTRLCLENYLDGCCELDKPYWVNGNSGKLPDRVIALNHMIIDMLKLADFPISFYLKNKDATEYRDVGLSKQKIKDLSLSPNFSARQIALAFFIVSHYVCDAHMPLHCDLRDCKAKPVDGQPIRRLPDLLHDGIEAVWEDSFPSKKILTIHKYSQESIAQVTNSLPDESIIELDKAGSPYALGTAISPSFDNEWDEMVNICRISYAVSRKWIPQTFQQIEAAVGASKCKDKKDKAPDWKYEDVTKVINEDDFKDVTNRVFHDAVESVARIWCKAWNIFLK